MSADEAAPTWAAKKAATLADKEAARHYSVGVPEAVLSLVVFAVGFACFELLVPKSVDVGSWDAGYLPGIAVTLMGLAGIGTALGYAKARKQQISKGAWFGAGLLLAGALPFAIFDFTPAMLLLGFSLIIGYIGWVSYLAGNNLSPIPGGMSFANLLNQIFCVPLRNLGAWFAGLKQLAGTRTRNRAVFGALISVLVSLPLLIVVVILLMNADTVFAAVVRGALGWLLDLNIWQTVLFLALAVPLGIYLFGLLYGNLTKSRVTSLTDSGVHHWLAKLHTIQPSALATPMALLCAVYLVFFVAMSSYLFSAFGGDLPAGFTYSGYARRGFFELAVIAVLNAAVLLFCYLFARSAPSAESRLKTPEGGSESTDVKASGRRLRSPEGVSKPIDAQIGYPKVLRIFGGILSGMTALLVLTALSKMWLYIDQLGLTQLRLYTGVFMVLMLVVSLLALAWHVHAFQVGRGIVAAGLVGLLFIGWCNPDAIIANYNVDRYAAGTLDSIDVNQLTDLSAAATPALHRLEAIATPELRSELEPALADRESRGTGMRGPAGWAPWTAWNWQAAANG